MWRLPEPGLVREDFLEEDISFHEKRITTQRKMSAVLLHHPQPYFLETESLSEPMEEEAACKSQGSSCSPTLWCCNYRHTQPHPDTVWVLDSISEVPVPTQHTLLTAGPSL